MTNLDGVDKRSLDHRRELDRDLPDGNRDSEGFIHSRPDRASCCYSIEVAEDGLSIDRDVEDHSATSGPWLKIDEVVRVATQEDVAVSAMSTLSFEQPLLPKLMDRIRAVGLDDVLVIVGGIVPDEDVPLLLSAALAMVWVSRRRMINLAKH